MLKGLKHIIEEAFRLGLTEALGGKARRQRTGKAARGSEAKRKGRRWIASPEERAARATLQRISFN